LTRGARRDDDPAAMPPPSEPPRTFDAWSLREAAQALLLVTAAVETGILPLLLRRAGSAAGVAAELGLDGRAVRLCLAALEEIGVVTPETPVTGTRSLTDFGRRRFADPASPSTVAADLPVWRATIPGWLFLADVLRAGEPLPVDSRSAARAALYASLDAKPPARVAALVGRVLARTAAARPRVLDVGGGSGVHARAFLARGCRVTLLERPDVLAHVRGAFDLDGGRGLDLVEGDAEAALPEGPWDVVLFADVLHELPPDRAARLLARAAAVCEPSAIAAVADTFSGRCAGAGFLGVTLLLHTRAGEPHAAADVQRWLEEAGFADARIDDLDPVHALITASRGGSRAAG
jgi:SAM-dependent methyltransferase